MPLKYKTIADSLKEEIMQRGPKGGNRLPTEQELMNTWHVSRQTVRQALSVLQAEGLIEKRQGSGAYISPSVFSQAAASQNIAILVPSAIHCAASRQILKMQKIIAEYGFAVRTYETENRSSQERSLLQRLLEQPVRALAVQGVRTAFPSPNLDLYQRLLNAGTAVLFLGSGYPQLPEIPCVSFDNENGGAMLTRHLLALGHKKIAGIFRLDDLSGHERYYGCVHTLSGQGLPFDDRNFLWYSAGPSGVPDPKLLLSFIRIQLGDCSAVICQSETVAALLIHELQKLGLRVPERITVTAFSNGFPDPDTLRITAAVPAKTTPWELAAQIIVQMANGKKAESVRCPMALQKGDTDAAPV